MAASRLFVWLLAVACLASAPAFGQNYPEKPVRMLVGFSPGGFCLPNGQETTRSISSA